MGNSQDHAGIRIAVQAGLSVLFVLTRAALLLPWLLISLPDKVSQLVLQCVLTAALWLLVVMPETGLRCRAFMRLNGDKKGRFSWLQALRVGLKRTLRAAWILLPTAAVALFLYYYIAVGDFTLMSVMRNIGTFVSGQQDGYDVGLGAVIALLAVCLIVLLFAWYRHTPNDYLGTLKPFLKAPYDRLALRNALLAAAAYVLWAVILYLNLSSQLSAYSGLMAKAFHVRPELAALLKQRVFRVEMSLVLILVYCPLWCVRKRGAAKAAARLGGSREA